MRKFRRLLLVSLGLLACLFIGFVAFLWLTDPKDRVTFESWKRLSKGMSNAEVERILGRPPDEVEKIVSEARVDVSDKGAKEVALKWFWFKKWDGEKARIWVIFGDNDADAVQRFAGDHFVIEESFLDKLRRWLRLPWW
jgi:hypothetical protein